MRRSLARAVEGSASGIEFDGMYVYEFYPGNPNAQTQRLLETAMDAWREHMQSCTQCPNRCLTEGFERTGMFDNLEKTGWPTR